MIDPWLLDKLVCPRTKTPLQYETHRLVSSDGYVYPVVHDIPILLFDDGDITHPAFTRTLSYAAQLEENYTSETSDRIDSYVQAEIAATNGNLYRSLIGNLKRYPIPHIRLPRAHNNELMLDIGCNWGRWSISAARSGYHVIGIDPNIDAILAAKRVCNQLNISSIHFVVADARWLPFAAKTFDIVFSYSVLQHLSKDNVRKCLREVRFVLKEDGKSLIQMPNKYGMRNVYNQLRGVQDPNNIFRVRYWSTPELKSTFSELIGESEITVDGFGGLGIQPADIDLLPRTYRLVVRASEILRRISERLHFLINLADSVYISSTKSAGAA